MSVGKEKINVLSLFDGISCGQIALERQGFEIENYFASEIDKYAMQITMANYPNTKQLGDVRNVTAEKLPNIHLLIGGSPCQGFSFAGAGLNFEDERSKLFFEFVRLKNELKPKYFLLENVKMKQEFQDIISEQLGVKPIMINSSLVSAQNRERLYWTNIPVIGQPNDKGILLKDIIEDGECLKDKSQTILATLYKENAKSMIKRNKQGLLILKNIYPKKGQNGNVYSIFGKCKTLCAGVGIKGNGIGNSNALKIESINADGWRKLSPLECERLQTVPDGYTKYVSDTQRYKALGNGWTVDVISFIFSFLRGENFLNSFSHESSIEAQK
jgi:DNA-cytosine methyltransferase